MPAKEKKYETSNAISYKSRSNMTSHSSPFTENNKSSHSYILDPQKPHIPPSDPTSLSRDKPILVIERPKKTHRSPEIAKTYKSDDKPIGNRSNINSMDLSFPMFYSQLDLIKDHITQKNERLSNVYGKARDKIKARSSGLISKNFILFKKIGLKTKEFNGKNSGSTAGLACISKKMQGFFNDLSWFNDEKTKNHGFFLEKHEFFKGFFEGIIENMKKSDFFIENLKNMLFLFFFFFLCLYSVALPLDVAYQLLPSSWFIMDIFFVVILIAKLIYKLIIESKKPDYLKKNTINWVISNIIEFLLILTAFSYIFHINDLYSLCFSVFAIYELTIYMNKNMRNMKIFNIFLIFLFFLIFHNLACLWEVLINSGVFIKSNWIERHDLEGIDEFTRYLNVFNYITTVPFYKEYNSNVLEQIFYIFNSILAFIAISYGFIRANKVFLENYEKTYKNQYIYCIFI